MEGQPTAADDRSPGASAHGRCTFRVAPSQTTFGPRRPAEPAGIEVVSRAWACLLMPGECGAAEARLPGVLPAPVWSVIFAHVVLERPQSTRST